MQIGRTGCISVNVGVTGAVDAAGAGLSATVSGSFGTSSECRCGMGKESVGLMCCVHKAQLTIKVADPAISSLSLSLTSARTEHEVQSVVQTAVYFAEPVQTGSNSSELVQYLTLNLRISWGYSNC